MGIVERAGYVKYILSRALYEVAGKSGVVRQMQLGGI